jgi:nitrous oxidase accessory protein NosD
VLLGSGNYGDFRFNSLNPTAVVTIKSANPNADAVFDSLTVLRSSNFVFEDIDVNHVLKPDEKDFSVAVSVGRSRDISFVGVDFYGSLNGNANDDGNGLSVSHSQRVAVLDSTFRQFNNATIFNVVDDMIFAGNSVTEAREGMNLAQVNGGLVERNAFTRIVPDVSRGDHADTIQVHAGGVYRTSNELTIRANVIKVGDSEAQGIFITSQKSRLGQLHTDIVVENNYYEGNSRHGITVSDTVGLSVSGNTVRDMGTMGLAPAINISNARDGSVDHNIAPLLLTSRTAPNTNVTFADNIDLWDRAQKVGLADIALFSAAPGSQDIDFSSLDVRANSVAAANGIGFSAVEGIGDIKAGAAAIMAAYLPQFDNHLAQLVMI